MKAWLLKTNGEVIEHDYTGSAVDFAGKLFGGDITLDLTRVMWNKKSCTAIVDDLGHPKGLPKNAKATAAYLEHCVPGTDWYLVGDVIVFDGRLP